MIIDNDYVITTDGSNNIILNQRIYKPVYKEVQDVKKNTLVKAIDHYEATDRFKPVGYYSKLEHLYNSILDRQLIVSGMHDLEQVLKAVKEVREYIGDIAIIRQKDLNMLKEE